MVEKILLATEFEPTTVRCFIKSATEANQQLTSHRVLPETKTCTNNN